MEEMQGYIETKVMPKLVEKAEGVATGILDKYKKNQYEALNESLAAISPTDEVTGSKIAKVWQDFDLDRSSTLESKELFRLNSFVWTEGQKRVNDGKVTKEEFDDAKKKTGVASAGILAAAAGAWALSKMKKKEPSVVPPPKDSVKTV